MLTLKISNGTKSLQVLEPACDNCNLKRIKCDRLHPSCSNCQDFMLTCSRKRQFGVRSKVNYENIASFSVTEEKQSLFSKASKAIYPEKELRSSSSNLYLSNDWSSVLQKWWSRAIYKIYFYQFIRLVGISLVHATSEDRTLLASLLLEKIQLRNLETKVPLELISTSSCNETLLIHATNAYFHYFNPFYPLFTRLGFETKKRSFFLRLAVCRVGLQFLNKTVHRDALAGNVERQLLKMTRLSQIKFNIDSVQALLCLTLGLYDTKISSLGSSFFSLISTIIPSLGLDKSKDLECQLAFQLANYIDYTYCYPRSSTFLSTTFNSLHKKLFRKNAVEQVQLSSRFFLNFPQPSSSYQNTSFSDCLDYQKYNIASWNITMDLCIFITNTCFHQGILILKDINLQFTIAKKDKHLGKNLSLAIIKALQRLRKVFSWGFCQLKKAHIQASYNTLILLQMYSVLCIRFHFVRLQLMEIACYIPNNPQQPLTSLPIINFMTLPASLGLESAMKLVSLMSRISSGPFLFCRPFILTLSFRFITQCFHTYAKSGKDPKPLLDSLLLARQLMNALKSTHVSAYESECSLKLFPVLLSRQNIPIS